MHKPEPFVFTAYNKWLEYWPLIVVGYLLAGCNKIGMLSEETIGIVFLLVCLYTSMAIAMTFKVESTWILFLLGSLMLTLLTLIGVEYNLPIYTTLLRWIGIVDFKLSRTALTVWSTVWLLVWLIVWAYCKICHRWVVSVGKMERRVFGRRAEEEPIHALRPVMYDVPDLMDWTLTFGGGNLEIRDAHGTVVKTIEGAWRVKSVDEKIDAGYEVLPTDDTEAVAAGPPAH